MNDAVSAGTELAEARSRGVELAEQIEEGVRARVRMSLRAEFETDAVREAFEAPGDPAPRLRQLLAAHSVHGAEDVFEDSITELVSEVAAMRLMPPSMYLVDQSTGRAVIPFRNDMVYQPPDYVGLDGVTRPARPVLHPGVAAPLTEAAHERGVEAAMLAAPGPSTEHLSDAQSIVRHAREALLAAGYDDAGAPDGPCREAEVGREPLESARQASGSAVWRARMFGAALAKRVAATMDESGSRGFRLGEAVRERNSRRTWYSVTYQVV